MRIIAPLVIKPRAAKLFITLLSKPNIALRAEGEFATEYKKESLGTDTDSLWAKAEPFGEDATVAEIEARLSEQSLGPGELIRILRTPEFKGHRYVLANLIHDLVQIDRETGIISFLTEDPVRDGVLVFYTYKVPEASAEDVTASSGRHEVAAPPDLQSEEVAAPPDLVPVS